MPEADPLILVVDDDRDVLVAARLLLKQEGYRVRTESDPRSIPEVLEKESPAVVLLDMNFTQEATSGREGFYWLRQIREQDPAAVVLLITAYGDVEMAVRAIKEGAVDFALKPWQNEKLLATVSAAVELHRSRREAGRLRSRQQRLSADLDRPFAEIVGEAPVLQEVFRTVAKVAETDASVLILGENGSGKELVAREIHRRSQRAGEVFIAVDLGSLSETLFESELFGHVKGAFTDARSDRAGRFEIASGGTLFLDEIGNLPLSLQVKLLAALENRRIVRVGANHPVPGNVRELQHAVERAVIMSEGDQLTSADFLLTAAPPPGESLAFDSYNLEEVEGEVIARVLRKHQGNVSRAARELGLTRTALYRRMEKHGL